MLALALGSAGCQGPPATWQEALVREGYKDASDEAVSFIRCSYEQGEAFETFFAATRPGERVVGTICKTESGTFHIRTRQCSEDVDGPWHRQ